MRNLTILFFILALKPLQKREPLFQELFEVEPDESLFLVAFLGRHHCEGALQIANESSLAI